MRSAIDNSFLDCPVESYFTPQVVCKWVQSFRSDLEMLTGYLKRALIPFHLSTTRSGLVNDAEYSSDGFDWRLNDFAYKSEQQSTSLPHRAWRRHSAVLTLAREMSEPQTDIKDIPESNTQDVVACCETMHCNVCEINRLPIWASSFSDMGLIDSDNSIDLH